MSEYGEETVRLERATGVPAEYDEELEGVCRVAFTESGKKEVKIGDLGRCIGILSSVRRGEKDVLSAALDLIEMGVRNDAALDAAKKARRPEQ